MIELEAILTVTIIEQSYSGTKNNEYFLQETEVVNADAHLTADASKIKEDDEILNISMEEEQETVKY